MSNENLRFWEQFADIDPEFTKPIRGKLYKGTSPNPHYVIRCLTEMFGPVGEGFGWEVTAEGFQPLGDEVLHWCRIRFWHGGGNGFDAYGQTKAVMKTKNGVMTDEDAPKKSLTDAITKAAAQIGVASNIFLGRWDDNKYVAEVNQSYRDAEKSETTGAGRRTPDEPREIGSEFDHAQEHVALVQLVRNQKTKENLDDLLATDRFQCFKEVAPYLAGQLRAEIKAQYDAIKTAGFTRAA